MVFRRVCPCVGRGVWRSNGRNVEPELELDLAHIGGLIFRAASEIAVPLARDIAVPLANLTIRESMPYVRSAMAQTRAMAASVTSEGSASSALTAARRAARQSKSEEVERRLAEVAQFV